MAGGAGDSGGAGPDGASDPAGARRASSTGTPGSARDPVADLKEIAFQLERAGEATYRVRAFRSAAATLAALDPGEMASRSASDTLTQLPGVGDVTARCVQESLAGEEPVYLRRLVATAGVDLDRAAAELRAALRGDCHSHSDWSDGGSPIEEMALAAVRLGHEYLVITDHSPRLAIARGLTADRLRRQLDVIAGINARLPEGFRVLSGIEVDILADGSLDQDPDLLAGLDVVVGSVHSGLNADPAAMTARMLAAIANPDLDILGHCTGRRLSGRDAAATADAATDNSATDAGTQTSADGGGADRRGADRRGVNEAGVNRRGVDRGGSDRAHRSGAARAESAFDAAAVFAACIEHDKAVEVNCRPDRLDPPKRLLRQAIEAGCRFAIDTDAHAPGQLDWLAYGCERAARCGLSADLVVNAWPAKRLLAWAARH
jgi:putative hydrolase